MARRQVVISDLTGKIIDKPEEEHAYVRILSHPQISAPIQLDAGALEVAGLKGKNDLVEIELELPNTPPEKLVVDLAVFDKLFKGVDADNVLTSADPYHAEPDAPEPRRRGRPAGSKAKTPAAKPTGSGMSKEELANVRSWAQANGHQVSSRGRIAAPILALYEEAHKG